MSVQLAGSASPRQGPRTRSAAAPEQGVPDAVPIETVATVRAAAQLPGALGVAGGGLAVGSGWWRWRGQTAAPRAGEGRHSDHHTGSDQPALPTGPLSTTTSAPAQGGVPAALANLTQVVTAVREQGATDQQAEKLLDKANDLAKALQDDKAEKGAEAAGAAGAAGAQGGGIDRQGQDPPPSHHPGPPGNRPAGPSGAAAKPRTTMRQLLNSTTIAHLMEGGKPPRREAHRTWRPSDRDQSPPGSWSGCPGRSLVRQLPRGRE